MEVALKLIFVGSKISAPSVMVTVGFMFSDKLPSLIVIFSALSVPVFIAPSILTKLFAAIGITFAPSRLTLPLPPSPLVIFLRALGDDFATALGFYVDVSTCPNFTARFYIDRIFYFEVFFQSGLDSGKTVLL